MIPYTLRDRSTVAVTNLRAAFIGSLRTPSSAVSASSLAIDEDDDDDDDDEPLEPPEIRASAEASSSLAHSSALRVIVFHATSFITLQCMPSAPARCR